MRARRLMKPGPQPHAAARLLELRAAKPFAHEPAHERHAGLSADKNDLVEGFRIELRVGQRAQAMLPRAADEVARETLEFVASEGAIEAEVRREERQGDFDFRLG